MHQWPGAMGRLKFRSHMQLENCKIVMVGTTHPGNVGAAARAMQTMRLSCLALVDPQCPIGEIAYARASGANAVLDQRETFETLSQAIADCHCVIATSARRRSLSWPEVEAGELGEMIAGFADDHRVALVFGREHSGLSNEELQLCNYMVRIPTNPDFSSLNVAAAVQLLGYEIFRHHAPKTAPKSPDTSDLPANSAELEGMLMHLQQVMQNSGFLDPTQPNQIMQRMRRLFLRSEMTRNEINILRGLLSAVEKTP